MKAQSSLEYLMTYGWAILIIGVVVAGLYALGIFNTAQFTPNLCVFPADFGCYSAPLFANGNILLNLEQSTSYPINVTAVGCNDAGNTNYMYGVNSIVSGANSINIQIGANYTFMVPCYKGASVFKGTIGQLYTGYVVVNYTDTVTGFQHQVVGKLVQKVA